MHSSSFSHRSLPRRVSTRILIFSLLAFAAAAPSYAGWSWGGKTRGSPPTISGTPPAGVTVGQTYLFRPTAADPDSTTLSFRVGNLPAWARFDGATGTLVGAPSSASVGTYSNIQIRVTDGRNWASLPAFSITVSQPTVAATANHAPTISGSPVTSARADQPYAFKPTTSDADGDSLTFSIQGRPAWATFNGSDGTLYGTPTASDVGTSSSIVISVSDGKASASLPAFSIAVSALATNHAPTISGSPVTSARAGQPYAFRPTASDADGDGLTFGIQGRPAWATFDGSDGTLYGTPTASDVGTSSSTVISVSDGKASASLPAFSIAVAPAPTASVTLSWRPPTTNVDGTPVTDIAGFRVFYGEAAGQYSHSLLVASPDVTTVLIEGLAPATTWYFSVKAFTTGQVESDYSAEVSKTLLGS